MASVASVAVRLLMFLMFFSSMVYFMISEHHSKLLAAKSIKMINDSDIHINLGRLLQASGMSQIRSALKQLGYPMTVQMSTSGTRQSRRRRRVRMRSRTGYSSSNDFNSSDISDNQNITHSNNETLYINVYDEVNQTYENYPVDDTGIEKMNSAEHIDTIDLLSAWRDERVSSVDDTLADGSSDLQGILDQWQSEVLHDLEVHEETQALHLLKEWKDNQHNNISLNNQEVPTSEIDPLELLTHWHERIIENIQDYELESIDYTNINTSEETPQEQSNLLKYAIINFLKQWQTNKELNSVQESVDNLEQFPNVPIIMPKDYSVDTGSPDSMAILSDWHADNTIIDTLSAENYREQQPENIINTQYIADNQQPPSSSYNTNDMVPFIGEADNNSEYVERPSILDHLDDPLNQISNEDRSEHFYEQMPSLHGEIHEEALDMPPNYNHIPNDHIYDTDTLHQTVSDESQLLLQSETQESLQSPNPDLGNNFLYEPQQLSEPDISDDKHNEPNNSSMELIALDNTQVIPHLNPNDIQYHNPEADFNQKEFDVDGQPNLESPYPAQFDYVPVVNEDSVMSVDVDSAQETPGTSAADNRQDPAMSPSGDWQQQQQYVMQQQDLQQGIPTHDEVNEPVQPLDPAMSPSGDWQQQQQYIMQQQYLQQGIPTHDEVNEPVQPLDPAMLPPDDWQQQQQYVMQQQDLQQGIPTHDDVNEPVQPLDPAMSPSGDWQQQQQYIMQQQDLQQGIPQREEANEAVQPLHPALMMEDDDIARQLKPVAEHGNIPYRKTFVQLASNQFGNDLMAQSEWLNRQSDKDKLGPSSDVGAPEVETLGSLSNDHERTSEDMFPDSNTDDPNNSMIYEDHQKEPLPLPNLGIHHQLGFMDPQEAEKHIFTTLENAQELANQQNNEALLHHNETKPNADMPDITQEVDSTLFDLEEDLDPDIEDYSNAQTELPPEVHQSMMEMTTPQNQLPDRQPVFQSSNSFSYRAPVDPVVGTSQEHSRYHRHHPPVRPYRDEPIAKEQTLKSKVPTASKNTNVIFYSYLRGGSSISSEMFNRDPDTFFWYEPLDAFYSAHFGIPQQVIPSEQVYNKNGAKREFLSEERRWLINFFRNIFECKLDELPPDVFAHDFRHKSDNLHGFTSCYQKVPNRVTLDMCRGYTVPLCGETVEDSIKQQCHVVISASNNIRHDLPSNTNGIFKIKDSEMAKYVAKLRDTISRMKVKLPSNIQKQLDKFVTHQICVNSISEQIAPCLPKAKSVCKDSGLHVTKVLRLRFDELEELSFLYPKLKVVYLTRDPRGIAYSRAENSLIQSKRDPSYIEESKFVCARIRSDLKKKDIIQKRYPTKVLTVKYEAFAQNPDAYAKKVYTHLGKSVPRQWKEFLGEMNRAKTDDGPYGLMRKNPMKTAIAWKRLINASARDTMYFKCKNELEQLGYDR